MMETKTLLLYTIARKSVLLFLCMTDGARMGKVVFKTNQNKTKKIAQEFSLLVSQSVQLPGLQ